MAKSRQRIRALLLAAAFCGTAAQAATSSGPPMRLDFEAAAPRGAAPVVETYEPGPPFRLDFEARAPRAAAPVVQVYEAGPPFRLDFESSSRRSSY